MLKKIIFWFRYLMAKIKAFSIVRKLYNEAKLYEGPLKTIEKGFKPFKWFQDMYDDSSAEIMKLRVGFKNITVLKFDMDKLCDICLKGDKIILQFIGTWFYNFGISGGICATNGYKMLWLDTKFIFVDSKLFDSLNEENRRFFLLHEVGHIVLGHHEGVPDYDENGNRIQILNYDFEYQADTYARGYVKPCDSENAIKAFSENKFRNRILMEVFSLSNPFLSREKIKESTDASIVYEIKCRFKGNKFDPNECAKYVTNSVMDE